MHIVREASRDRYLLDGESSMGRDILSCVVRSRNNTVDILILTTHLESGTGPRAVNTRTNQYRQVLQRLICPSDPNDYSPRACILCGDFNLREDEDSEVRNNIEGFGSSFYDAHTVTNSPHPYTWKRKYPYSKYFAHARFDRQMYSGSIFIKNIDCSYSLVGCESISETNELLIESCGYRTPSDHFGVLCRYQLLSIIQQGLSISSSPLLPEDTHIGRPTKHICLRPPEVVDLT
jgi:endonuclease/exonuclease/phosphatase family metal-dependent hydrolase